MAVELGTILASPIFTFLIGPSEKPVEVHIKAIAGLSPALSALVSNGMRESIDRVVKLPFQTEECFMRFCEFAYSSTYSVPKPERASYKGCEEGYVPLSWTRNFARFCKEHTNKRSSARGCVSTYAGASKNQIMYEEVWGVRAINRLGNVRERVEEGPLQCYHYASVFLSHAELYVFADKYQITTLMQLTSERLTEALPTAYQAGASLGDYTALVHYIYCEDESLSMALMHLRGTITLFLCSKAHLIVDNEEFEALLRKGGDFVVDFRTQLSYAMNMHG